MLVPHARGGAVPGSLLEFMVPRPLVPTTRYRNGERTPISREAHAKSAAQHRREILLAMFPKPVRNDLLSRVRGRAGVRKAAEQVGVTYQAVYALARIDQAFSDALDDATLAGCVCQGTGWRRHSRGGRRCDCPTAREHRAQEAREYRRRQQVFEKL